MAAMKRMMMFSLLVIAACSKGGSDQSQDTTPTALVELARAEAGNVTETVDIYGSAQNDPSSQGTLAAPAEATVARIVVPEGSPVRSGQLIATLAPSPSTLLDLANARASLNESQQALERAARLRADGLVSDAEVETARATAQRDSATVSSLSGRNAGMDLRAPVSGFVQPFPVSPGDLVAAGTVIAVLARAGDVRVRFGIDPAMARRVSSGASLRIIRGGSTPPLSVPVRSVDPVVDPQTGLASLYARVPAASGIAAGESLRAQLALRVAQDTLSVPYKALLDEAGQSYVFVVTGNTAHRRDVEIGAVSNDRAAILRGLSAGDAVVTKGATALEDGMKVRTR